MGVRGRFLLAFASIMALSMLGAIAALLTFSYVEMVVNRVVREGVPTTLAALDLSRQAERLASIAPRLVADETMAEKMRTDRIVRREIADLEKLMAQVKIGSPDSPLISDIEDSVAQIRKNLGDLQTLREPWVDSSIEGYSSTGKPVDPMLESAWGVLLAPTRDELLSKGQKMIQSNIKAAERLTAAVDRLVDAEKAKMIKAEADVLISQQTGALVLFGVLALGLVSSVLIVWLYVGRSVVGRLMALSASMLAIAGGNLKASLPEIRGADEIGSMADALRIFRDKVIENERLSRLKGFLAPQVAELIVTSGDESVLDSHRRDVAVLFCDLRGFTAFAETSEPEEIMEFLRDYHQTLGELVHRFAGTLERFTGDGLIVLFNDPLPTPNPCLAAAELAVEMRAGINEVIGRRHLRERLGFGIGICYGYATLGRIGFKGRFDYTAIGSVVNLASRLCERAQAGQILMDRKVHEVVSCHLRTERLGEFVPKGFGKPVEVFNVVSIGPSSD